MRRTEPDDEPQGPPGRFGEDLVGLDPHDPEAQAFAKHLDRIEHAPKPYTVEGYLAGVSEFADSANRVGGGWRLAAVVVTGLILIGLVLTFSGALNTILLFLF
ncbi:MULTISPECIES: hypothetical protein [unclassified Crossiella]|uniref:hypothetical protein n=1 Tax=unclassified Crossiella TaxID=2620835 RepID=UPI00207CEB65|nr:MULTISPECIES: hypothetical protein [unclassified Crossiella]MCO1574892.1 hypothetical protein [Crossiella sp. SN42]WHT21540.1 hypothetical protein N8J89_10910 [Crossiella sp. CA-258035]